MDGGVCMCVRALVKNVFTYEIILSQQQKWEKVIWLIYFMVEISTINRVKKRINVGKGVTANTGDTIEMVGYFMIVDRNQTASNVCNGIS